MVLRQIHTRHLSAAVAFAAFFIALLCGTATAHPMGPNSYNHYSAITVHADSIEIFHIADLAEFPTYSIIKNEISSRRGKTWTDAELAAYKKKICPELAGRLKLTIDGRPAALKTASCRVEIRPSKFAPVPAANRRDLRALERRRIPWYTLWIELKLSAPAAVKPGRESAARFEDRSYPGKLAGWKEIELLDSDSARVTSGRQPLGNAHSSRLDTDKLNELMGKMDKAGIPQDTAATFSYEAGAGAQTRPGDATRVKGSWLARAKSALPELPELLDSRYFLPAALLLAFLLGCLHALSPGHGKTLVAAYLIGSSGRVSDALFLGLVVTVSHVFSVVVLGVIILLATSGIDNQRVEELLQLGSGVVILLMGLWMFARNRSGHAHTHDHEHPHSHTHGHEHPHTHPHEHAHDHHHEHEHPHSHTHEAAPERAKWWDILALGVTGGIVPCPTALIVLFSAVALNKIGFGLTLIAMFSVGLAAVLIAIGIIMVKAKGFMDKHLRDTGAIRILPYISAAIITAIGVAFIARAADALGWL